jgi:hypothetical protein
MIATEQLTGIFAEKVARIFGADDDPMMLVEHRAGQLLPGPQADRSSLVRPAHGAVNPRVVGSSPTAGGNPACLPVRGFALPAIGES